MNLVSKLGTFLFALTVACASSEEVNPYAQVGKLMVTLDIPKEFNNIHDFNPVTYLELFEKKQLATAIAQYKQPEAAKTMLAALFIAANNSTLTKYGQSYSISETCAAFSTLQGYFPDLKSLPREPGGSLRMDEIAGKLAVLTKPSPPSKKVSEKS